MKRNVLLWALGCSLLFNVFVLIGFMQGRSQQKESPATAESTAGADGSRAGSTGEIAGGRPEAESEDKLARQVARDLQLDEEQSRLFAELRKSMKQEAAVFDESAALIHQSILAEMKKDSPDAATLRELMERRADLDRLRRVSRAEHFEEFVQSLTPAQRKQMLRRMGPGPGIRPGMGLGGGRDGGPFSPPPPPPLPHEPGAMGPADREDRFAQPEKPNPDRLAPADARRPIMLGRFDRNRNGQLERDEIDAAQREIISQWELLRRARMRAGAPPGPEMMRRFDADRDGRLNEQERAAMDQFRREHVGEKGIRGLPPPGTDDDIPDDGPLPDDEPPPPPRASES